MRRKSWIIKYIYVFITFSIIIDHGKTRQTVKAILSKIKTLNIIDFLDYKGFKGTIEWSDEDNCFFGRVLNVKGSVSYEGSTLEELEKDFHEAVDDYISCREELGMNNKSKTI